MMGKKIFALLQIFSVFAFVTLLNCVRTKCLSLIKGFNNNYCKPLVITSKLSFGVQTTLKDLNFDYVVLLLGRLFYVL